MSNTQKPERSRPRPTIAELNDAFRSSFLFGEVLLTPGISALPDEARAAVIAKVQAFDDFPPGDDPYGEHDFGAFSHPGAGKIFWKIDYYDEALTFGSDDPADPAKTRRVLTIMLGSEY